MKLLRWILLPPLAIIVIALAIANRHSVTFSLDPFDAQNPAISFDLPLAAIILISIALGILIGGLAAWWQGRRRTSRRLETERRKQANAPIPAAKSAENGASGSGGLPAIQ
ncbi:LapA family protein [Parvibaculum sp.]|uniref:LapA family protein n=1 Tax=Parvibaculum sp. TaxID=2024848 RepID=UPI0025DA0E24|nr:LapA family protein [Parvibaculum sp.]